ncbi:MAG: M48 family metallopeptidase, partial [Gammaproteobacteria bacterium]|nr:M48 family metallopeptidase [Gammaproteobacteria bacterium]
MDFFARQSAARGLSRRLIALFVLAVVVVVATVDAIILTAVAVMQPEVNGQQVSPLNWLAAHPGVIAITTLIVLGSIVLASLYKSTTLRAGGGVVARSVGGEKVASDTRDPLRRRLLNVVEEMAIASGVPMPEVYVLEHETGINAFAAGHSPADAAVAVTRGTLENLTRSELQGVIGHEFSHILNGDMRINIRLMGMLFGLLVIAISARMVLRFLPRHHGGSDRKGGGALVAIMLAAVAVLIVGYVGLFFGRMIQAAVSRGREQLADASAVQFTRDPAGIRNALVKIGALSEGSRLQDADSDEVAHMLFASGMGRMFATHPPLVARIKAIDPQFSEREFAEVRRRLENAHTEVVAEEEQLATTAAERMEKMLKTAIVLAPNAVAGMVGNPGTPQIAAAQSIRASLPGTVEAASSNLEDAVALLLALALDADGSVRARQLAYLQQFLNQRYLGAVQRWLPEADALNVLQRQPALLRLFPTLRQLSGNERRRICGLLESLQQMDGHVSIQAYAMRKLAYVHLYDPVETVADGGRVGVPALAAELGVLFSTIAQHGHADATAAGRAYEAGIATLLPQRRPSYTPRADWAGELDAALDKLDALAPAGKELLIGALVRTIAHDGRLTVEEAELLRAVCATLHCPLPPLVSGES